MNFKKLQAMQLELDNSILSAKPQMTAEERFNKTLVALSVEVAEVANCAEHFKFWKDNKGKVDEKRFLKSYNSFYEEELYSDKVTGNREISFEQAHKLTLVEECSDCLHFILSLANQLDLNLEQAFFTRPPVLLGTDFCYIYIQNEVASILEKTYLIEVSEERDLSDKEWEDLCLPYQKLGDFYFNYINGLGITTQELEQAYYEKNEENYRRLREGY